MKSFKWPVIIACLLLTGIFVVSCEKEKKQGKVIVAENEFVVRQDTDHSFVIDASGKVRNVGDVDVKKVIVTGYCQSCGEMILPGQWFISDTEKTENQKDTISYLVAGGEETFDFKEVAFYFGQPGIERPEKPEQLEIVIESFETVDK